MNTPNTNLDASQSDYHEEWLTAYLDEELSPEHRLVVEQKLERDPATRQLLNDLQCVRGLVSSLPAWPSHRLDVLPAGVASTLHAQRAPASAQPQDPTLGDYHSELQPRSLSADSIASTLDEELHSEFSAAEIRADLRSRPLHRTQRFEQRWLKPLVTTACLLIMAGIAYGLWQTVAPRSLATNRSPDEAAAPTNEPASRELEEAVKGEASELATDRDSALQLQLPDSLGRSDGTASAAEMAAPPAASFFEGSPPPQAKSRAMQLPQSEPARSAAPQSETTHLEPTQQDMRGSLAMDEAPTDGAVRRGVAEANFATTRIKIAYSDGWSEAEVRQAMAYVAPRFNLSSAIDSGGADNENYAFRQPAASGGLLKPTMVIASRRPSGAQTAELDAMPKENQSHLNFWYGTDNQFSIPGIALKNWEDVAGLAKEGNVANGRVEKGLVETNRVELGLDRPAEDKPLSDSQLSLGGLANPRGGNELRAPVQPGVNPGFRQVPVVLFVLRSEAEHILQQATAAGEIQSSPVWISSIDAESATSIASSADSKVVLLLNP